MEHLETNLCVYILFYILFVFIKTFIKININPIPRGVSGHPIPGGDAILHHPAFLDNK